MAVLTPRDELAWQQLGHRVASPIERVLDRRVLANRGPATGRAAIGRTLAVAKQRADRMAERWPFLLRTDVASFYGSVTAPVLAESLRSSGADPVDARLAADMLEEWGSEGYEGLPIGPPASAVMANAVLRPVDRAFTPMPFLRWVDDYLVGLWSERAVDDTIDRIDSALDHLSLERSKPKSVVLEGGRSRPWLGAVSVRERSC